MREVEERRRSTSTATSATAFGLASSTPDAADALSPPPLALPPGVAAVSAILAHASMSACSECEMACCPLSGTRLGGSEGAGSGGGGGDGKSGGGGNSSSSSSSAAATSRLVEGGEGFFAGGIDGCSALLEPPEVDEH